VAYEGASQVRRRALTRAAALELEIIQGKTTIAEASRSYDLRPSELLHIRQQPNWHSILKNL
jgi:hypothetical protein